MIQKNQIGRILSAFPHRPCKFFLFIFAQYPAHRIEFKQTEPIIAAQRNKNMSPFFRLFLRISVAVGAAPDAQSRAACRRIFRYRRIAAGILRTQFFSVRIAVTFARAVKISRVPRVNIQPHAVLFIQFGKKGKIRQRLRLCGAFVRIVDPRKIFAAGRRFFRNFTVVSVLIPFLLVHRFLRCVILSEIFPDNTYYIMPLSFFQ